MKIEPLSGTFARLFGDKVWPRPAHLLYGVKLVQKGVSPFEAAKRIGTRPSILNAVIASRDPVGAAFGTDAPEQDKGDRDRTALVLGQLLLGRCAEATFERIYRSEVHSDEFELKDLREGRTDTDYRLLNGRGRPLFRINIKFHGSPFRRASELVGLKSEDCFALATYKIHSALQKQRDDALPYFFAIVGVPHLTGAGVGIKIPSEITAAIAVVRHSKKQKALRTFEDAAIEYLVSSESEVYRRTLDEIAKADWYVLSARRAEQLLRTMLFDRVFALRVPRFNMAFRGAELDMHFSLSKDMTPLRRFLGTLREEGPQKLATLMERGEF